jgi:Uncharacterized protein related to deoxyribodipyrimidine photolyase
MKHIQFVFPHQLFEQPIIDETVEEVILIEEYLFFKQYPFHKKKLIYHRATMKMYEEYLKKKGYNAKYIDTSSELADVRELIHHLAKKGIVKLTMYDVVDTWLQKRIERSAAKYNITIDYLLTPMFQLSSDYLEGYFKNKKRYFQTDFYKQARISKHILLDQDAQPIGGKWTFDTENRLRYPKGKKPPAIKFPDANIYLLEAKKYINQYFGDNPGSDDIHDFYPVTYLDAKAWLTDFLHNRFKEFGPYEDAIVMDENFLHHSVLTPMLNIGLLTPTYIIDETLIIASKHKISINSVEGFIRQILGWREFIRGIYVYAGSRQRSTNFWQHTRKIPFSFWNATTGIEPIDCILKKLYSTAYNHHIERLMVLGNFMLLCEFHPDEIYRWFMCMYIDAYDWVMVPNVYGMSQFADGGMMSTKPYISGSNYLLNMSDFKQGEWIEIWDGLFWRFIDKQRDFFKKNPRMNMLLKTFDSMGTAKKERLISVAENYLKNL